VHLLGCDERKPFVEIEPKLSSEDRVGPYSGSIGPNERTTALDSLLGFSIFENIGY
jgi:hypothetical protein